MKTSRRALLAGLVAAPVVAISSTVSRWLGNRLGRRFCREGIVYCETLNGWVWAAVDGQGRRLRWTTKYGSEKVFPWTPLDRDDP